MQSVTVLKRDALLRPEKVEVNGVLYTVKKHPVFQVAENRHKNVYSEWRDYFLLQNKEGDELKVHHKCDVLNEDKKVLNKFVKFCEFTRTASNDEFEAVYHVGDLVFDLKEKYDMFRTDDLFEVAKFKEMQHVVALLDATTQNWRGVTVQDEKGYEDMCPFKNEDRDTFCECDCPHFVKCDLHNTKWKKDKLVEQLEFYQQADMTEEVANVKKMLANF